MSRPEFPGCILPASCISRIVEEQNAYDRDPEGYERRKREWSMDECIARGSLPTGEPIEALFGQGPWSDPNDEETP